MGGPWPRAQSEVHKNGTGDVEVNFTSDHLAAEITTAAASVEGKGGGRGKGMIGRGGGRGRGTPPTISTSSASLPTPPPRKQPAKESVEPLHMTRCPQDPCVYSTVNDDDDGRVNKVLYVDDGRMHWDDTEASKQRADEIRDRLRRRFQIDFGPIDPPEDYFLGANRTTSANRDVKTIRATSYIDSMGE